MSIEKLSVLTSLDLLTYPQTVGCLQACRFYLGQLEQLPVRSGQTLTSSSVRSGQPLTPSSVRSGQPLTPSSVRSGQPLTPSSVRSGQPLTPSSVRSGQPLTPSSVRSGQPLTPSSVSSGQTLTPPPVVVHLDRGSSSKPDFPVYRLVDGQQRPLGGEAAEAFGSPERRPVEVRISFIRRPRSGV